MGLAIESIFTDKDVTVIEVAPVCLTVGQGGIVDGNKGDITVSALATVWTINNATVTLAKLASSVYSVTNTPNTLVLRDSTGAIAASNVSFSTITIPNVGVITGASYTSATTAADQLVDSFDITQFRTAKYTVQIESGTDYQSSEFLVTHDGSEPFWTRYAEISSAGDLADLRFDINGSNLRLLATPVVAITKFKVIRQTIAT
jgi:hypothetical protein